MQNIIVDVACFAIGAVAGYVLAKNLETVKPNEIPMPGPVMNPAPVLNQVKTTENQKKKKRLRPAVV
jgi:hypothetical protein